MKINMRALAICTMSSVMMTACTSMKNFEAEIEAAIGSQAPLQAQTQVQLQPVPPSALVAPEVTQAVSLPGDGPLEKAQKHFHQEEYGLSEKYFREASLENPNSLDAWLGLAASYDQLQRFELANRSYKKALKIGGKTPTILNNWGYSYLLRGNVVEARKKFLSAYELEPKNKAVNANLDLLREGIKRNSRQRT